MRRITFGDNNKMEGYMNLSSHILKLYEVACVSRERYKMLRAPISDRMLYYRGK